jgi:patatin-related protein
MSLWEQAEEDDYQDIRIAVVMNGGVSLAVWIGGVARELNRLTSAKAGDGSCYGQLLDVVRATARVDVFAGTSAGGINAGFLALAAAYGSDLKPLAGLWADKGGLLDLLRNPMDSKTPSLLKGDEYFLKELRRAFQRLLPADRKAAYRPPDQVPLDLTITTSILNGRIEQFEDDFGTPIPQREHRGRFHFVRDDRVSVEKDPFAKEAIWAQLALAARSTASFPFAFEASFVPVDPGTKEPPYHPRIDDSIANFKFSRFVVDGGVLLNMPVKPAIDAIFKQKADRQVNRVLAYINPDPGVVVESEPDIFSNPPSVADVMTAAMVRLPAAQSIAQDLSDLREHNRRVRDQRRLRPNLLADLGRTVQGLAPLLFDAYRRVRIARAANRIADLVEAAGEPGVPPVWVREEILAAFEAPEPPPMPALPFVPAGPELVPGHWDWGLAPVERLNYLAHDILKRGLFVCPLDNTAVRASLRAARGYLHDLTDTIEALRNADTLFWQEAALTLPEPPPVSSERKETLRQWAVDQAARWTDELSKPIGEAPYTSAEIELFAFEIVKVLADALPDLRAAAAGTDERVDPLMRDARVELNRILDTGVRSERTARSRRLPAAHAAGRGVLYGPRRRRPVSGAGRPAASDQRQHPPPLHRGDRGRGQAGGSAARPLRGLLQEELAGERLDLGTDGWGAPADRGRPRPDPAAAAWVAGRYGYAAGSCGGGRRKGRGGAGEGLRRRRTYARSGRRRS